MEPELERIVREYLAARDIRRALGEEANRLTEALADVNHSLLNADIRLRKTRSALDEYGLPVEVPA